MNDAQGQQTADSQRNARVERQSESVLEMKTFDFADTGGLFDHFEVNREPFWPQLSWLLGGSAVWHIVLIVMIVMIPPLREAFHITALVSGADFVDRPYNRTEIGDADIIDFTTEKFRYPDGYFAMDEQGMPPLPSTPAPVAAPFTPRPVSLQPTPSPTPTSTPSPTPTATPLIAANGAKPGDGTKPTDAKASSSPSPSAEDKAAEKAQKDLEAASKKTGIDLPAEGEINKAPFKDLAKYATELRDQHKLDFNKPFEVSIDTALGADGKFVKADVTTKSGDETLTDLGKRLVAAMNDSGVLFYLKKINEDKPGTKITFTIKQEGNDVIAMVESEVSSPSSAQVLSKDFAIMLAAGALSRKGKDEEVLLKKTQVNADGSKVVFKLTLPHDDAVEIVKKGIAAPSPSATPSELE
jgi:hypothetical protein